MSTAPGGRPFFLRGRAGPLFTIYFPPLVKRPDLGDLIYIPPFEEEMNRCRAMASMQARSLAKIGVGVLILDPFGTGDSGGDYSDGRWDLWQDDIMTGIGWLEDQGRTKIGYLGVRLGALIAMELATSKHQPWKIILWQPVVDGKNMMTQFLRIRIAASMDQRSAPETTKLLREMMGSGQTIEVSGYELAPELANAIENAQMKNFVGYSDTSVHWFEILPATDRPVPRVTKNIIDEWRNRTNNIHFHCLAGPPFWHVHERVLAPDLIEATSKIFMPGPAA